MAGARQPKSARSRSNYTAYLVARAKSLDPARTILELLRSVRLAG
jgi:hypothetical protein